MLLIPCRAVNLTTANQGSPGWVGFSRRVKDVNPFGMSVVIPRVGPQLAPSPCQARIAVALKSARGRTRDCIKEVDWTGAKPWPTLARLRSHGANAIQT